MKILCSLGKFDPQCKRNADVLEEVDEIELNNFEVDSGPTKEMKIEMVDTNANDWFDRGVRFCAEFYFGESLEED